MLRYLSLFSGIGAFEKALTNLGVNYEVVNYCEIDKYASKSYSAIHGVPESKNLWDITKVNVFNLPTDIDLLTYGFPCQDISLAGKQKGMFNEDGSLTRSGLFFKALDVIEYVKPKIAIAENVKALTSKKFTDEFKIVLDSLEKAGYHNYWKVLNAKDYGIPQNRERVFIVSIRKDIDHNIFEFPKPYSLEKRLKDFLEPHVDEKYYLSDKMVSYISAPNQKWTGNNNGAFINKDIASTLNTGEGSRRCDASNYVSEDLPDNYNLQNDEINVIGNYSPSGHHASRIVNPDGIAPTVTENHGTVTATTVNIPPLRIRKLTPKECYRLMGFDDEDFKKSESVPTSNTQLYKQAGNSIVVDVLEELMCMMLDEEDNLLV